jgi:hypothetical protein
MEQYANVPFLEEFIETDRASFERARDMHYKTGILSTRVLFASSKGVARCNFGRERNGYRLGSMG